MGTPEDRCGFTWPQSYNVGAEPDNESCCYRQTLSEADHCVWHLRNSEIEDKDELEATRAPAEVRNQNSPVSELLDGAYINTSERLPCQDFKGVSFRGAEFENLPLDYTFFQRADLKNSTFANVNLHKSNFTEADLRGADLSDAFFFQKPNS